MKFLFNNQEWYIDATLASQLDTVCYNLKKDWDFVLLITGDRSVRVGKSVLSMTVCAYLSYRLAMMKINSPYELKNVFFDHGELLKTSQVMPTNSIIHYDEGREGLAASKAMKNFQEQLMDFFAECGQLNHIFVIVLPDFFELREQIAVARSEYLINVYRGEERLMVDINHDGEKKPIVRFDRGFFEFFSRSQKKKLYDLARSMRRKSYDLVKPAFRGRFTNQYPLDEEGYRKLKRDALSRFGERQESQKEKDLSFHKADVIRDKIIMNEFKTGKNGIQISKLLEHQYGYSISQRRVNEIIAKTRGNIENE